MNKCVSKFQICNYVQLTKELAFDSNSWPNWLKECEVTVSYNTIRGCWVKVIRDSDGSGAEYKIGCYLVDGIDGLDAYEEEDFKKHYLEIKGENDV